MNKSQRSQFPPRSSSMANNQPAPSNPNPKAKLPIPINSRTDEEKRKANPLDHAAAKIITNPGKSSQLSHDHESHKESMSINIGHDLPLRKMTSMNTEEKQDDSESSKVMKDKQPDLHGSDDHATLLGMYILQTETIPATLKMILDDVAESEWPWTRQITFYAGQRLMAKKRPLSEDQIYTNVQLIFPGLYRDLMPHVKEQAVREHILMCKTAEGRWALLPDEWKSKRGNQEDLEAEFLLKSADM